MLLSMLSVPFRREQLAADLRENRARLTICAAFHAKPLSRLSSKSQPTTLVRTSGHRLDLDELSGPAENGHPEQCAWRSVLAEDLLDHPPSQRKVGVVGGSDVNGRLDDVVWPAGSGVEGDKEVVECLAGLARDVALADYVSVGIKRAGPRREDGTARRGARGIGIRNTGVERWGLDQISGHRRSLSPTPWTRSDR